jgi:hypothetical protein
MQCMRRTELNTHVAESSTISVNICAEEYILTEENMNRKGYPLTLWGTAWKKLFYISYCVLKSQETKTTLQGIRIIVRNCKFEEITLENL